MTDAERADLVYDLLKRGVPHTIVADAFGMERETIQAAQSQMRVDRYGTDELAEAMTFLIWEAFEAALHEIHHGPPASKFRYMQLVLARSIGLAGKSTPETSEKIRAELARMAADIAPPVRMTESIYTPSD